MRKSLIVGGRKGKILALIFFGGAVCAKIASANPMLALCLPVAPKSCALTDLSKLEDFLKCFDSVKLSSAKSTERQCAEELLHAKVHLACDKIDIPQLCGKIKPGGNRVMGCLNKNHEKLTKSCSSALDQYNELGNGDKKKNRRSPNSAVRC
jgi:hypothetical protein